MSQIVPEAPTVTPSVLSAENEALGVEESVLSAVATQTDVETFVPTLLPVQVSEPVTPTLAPTPSVFDEKVKPWEMPSIKVPKVVKSNLSSKENLEISLEGYNPEIFTIIVTDIGGTKIEVETEKKNDLIVVKQPREFRPGKYKVEVLVEGMTLINQNFTWGVLAINTDKSIYLPDEKVNFAMAVLDEEGKMVCDADLTLVINTPDNKQEILSTKNNKITVNPECQIKDYVTKPDYETFYYPKGTGIYNLTLIAINKNGTSEISDFFEVKNEIPFDVSRAAATRIYPPKTYPVIFNLKIGKFYRNNKRKGS